MAGKVSHWIGSLDAPRKYAYVPDATRVIASLAEVRARALGAMLPRPMSGFDAGLWALNPTIVSQVRAVRFDGSRLREWLGDVPATPCEGAVPLALDRLTARIAPRGDAWRRAAPC